MLLIAFIWIYSVIFIFRNKIETRVSFTGKGKLLTEVPKHFENIFLKDPFWNTIHGVYLDKQMQKTIFYFHGNSWSISSHIDEMNQLSGLWYNVLSYDYPWYGNSTGYPTEDNVYRCTNIFYDYVRSTRGITPENLIVFGHSIGSSIWSEFAYKNKIDKLILLSPLSSKYAVCKARYGIIFQKLLFMRNGFDTWSKIKHIDVPTLIIHGNEDTVISFEQWKNVFDNAKSLDKYFIILDGFWHSWIFKTFRETLNPIYQEFLEKGSLQEKIITIQS